MGNTATENSISARRAAVFGDIRSAREFAAFGASVNDYLALVSESLAQGTKFEKIIRELFLLMDRAYQFKASLRNHVAQKCLTQAVTLTASAADFEEVVEVIERLQPKSFESYAVYAAFWKNVVAKVEPVTAAKVDLGLIIAGSRIFPDDDIFAVGIDVEGAEVIADVMQALVSLPTGRGGYFASRAISARLLAARDLGFREL